MPTHTKHTVSTQQERLAGAAINLSIPVTLILTMVKEMTVEDLNLMEYIPQKVAEISNTS